MPDTPDQPPPLSTPPAGPPSAARSTFRRHDRLSHDLEYQAVYDTRIRKIAGPLSLSAKPNDLGRHRLGLAVPRKVGSAPHRSRLKRLIREAFRLGRPGFPIPPGTGYDFVVGVRAHESGGADPGLERCRELLVTLVDLVHRECSRRLRGAKE